jgi:hypothetical protein
VLNVSDVLLLALVPVLVVITTALTNGLTKRQQWTRDDKVAKTALDMALRAAKAAEKAAESNEKILSESQAGNEAAANNFKVLNANDAAIHGLVNSNLTAAKQATLSAEQVSLSFMRRDADRERQEGREPSVEDLTILATTEQKVTALIDEIDERLRQTAIADAQVAKGGE